MQVDERLRPAAADHQPGSVEHQHMAKKHRDLRGGRRQSFDERINAEMPVFAQGNHGAKKREPDEEDA
ncbi:hypothetical protein D3C85_1868730 [compost metagenome]